MIHGRKHTWYGVLIKRLKEPARGHEARAVEKKRPFHAHALETNMYIASTSPGYILFCCSLANMRQVYDFGAT